MSGRPHKKGGATNPSCAQEGKPGVDGGAPVRGFKMQRLRAGPHQGLYV